MTEQRLLSSAALIVWSLHDVIRGSVNFLLRERKSMDVLKLITRISSTSIEKERRAQFLKYESWSSDNSEKTICWLFLMMA